MLPGRRCGEGPEQDSTGVADRQGDLVVSIGLRGVRKATPADVSGIATVHLSAWQTTYRGLIIPGFLDSLTYEGQCDSWSDTLRSIDRSHFLYLAEVEHGAVVGFVFGGPERSGDPLYKGEVYAIYVVRDCQGKGIGRALFRRAVKELELRRLSSMILWVLAENPYRRFYERMGGELVHSSLVTIGGHDYQETAYGWANLRDWSRENPCPPARLG